MRKIVFENRNVHDKVDDVKAVSIQQKPLQNMSKIMTYDELIQKYSQYGLPIKNVDIFALFLQDLNDKSNSLEVDLVSAYNFYDKKL